MRIRLIGAVLVLAFAMPGAPRAIAENAAAAPSAYDADLARELGADELGMRNYVLVILRTGPNDGSIEGEERKEIFRGHFANIQRLADEGKLALAGPFGRNDKAFRGLFVFAVSTVEDARALAETDPALRAGIFTAEYVTWYGSAALMQVNSIHKRIAAQDI